VCGNCGYLHPVQVEPPPSTCEQCKHVFEARDNWSNMFRLQNVVTRRRQRINCDEEERLRLGYEIKTGVRFAERNGRPLFSSARLVAGDTIIANLRYGDAADLWRVNLGWSRRENKDDRGFWLDIERRQWTRRALDPDEEDDNAKPSRRVQKVIPYVKDRRNSLLVTFTNTPSEMVMASIEAALKRAIQLEYQLEDAELATEALPTRKDRRHLLIYEAAEGGAGVLRQLVDDPKAWNRLARRALELCHFDPETGADQGKAEHATENCQAACYDCLLSYYNQPDHELLDRQLIKELLQQIAAATVQTSPVEVSRGEHLERLKRLCDSKLEKDFLDFLDRNDLRLPERAQYFYEQLSSRPDFSYTGDNPAFIYVDGPPHDYPDRQQRDSDQTANLNGNGITVIRFHHKQDWGSIVRQHPATFGELK